MPRINRVELEFVAYDQNSADFRKGSAAVLTRGNWENKKARKYPGFFYAAGRLRPLP